MIEKLFTGSDATVCGKAPRLRAVLVYEDFDMATCSKSLGKVLNRAGKGSEVELSVWKYDFFHTAELAQTAGLQAAQAEIVIFAARRCDSVPEAVQGWLEAWSRRRQRLPGVLVAVFPTEAGNNASASPVGLLLQQTAVRAGMEFSCELAQAPASTLCAVLQTRSLFSPQATLSP